MADLVERLNEEAQMLSESSFNRGCAQCGVSSNLAAEAADHIEKLKEALEDLLANSDLDILSGEELQRMADAGNSLAKAHLNARTLLKSGTGIDHG